MRAATLAVDESCAKQDYFVDPGPATLALGRNVGTATHASDFDVHSNDRTRTDAWQLVLSFCSFHKNRSSCGISSHNECLYSTTQLPPFGCDALLTGGVRTVAYVIVPSASGILAALGRCNV